MRGHSFLYSIALAAAATTPALAETGATKGDIPNFTRVWQHPGFPWFEPPASGPGPVTNLSRWPQHPAMLRARSPASAASRRGRRERL